MRDGALASAAMRWLGHSFRRLVAALMALGVGTACGQVAPAPAVRLPQILELVGAFEALPAAGVAHDEALASLQRRLGELDPDGAYYSREQRASFATTPAEDQALQWRRIEPGLLLLRPGRFGETTLRDGAAALGGAGAEAPFKGVVLDLRGSPGGLLDATVGLAAIFLTDDDLVLQTRGASADSTFGFRARASDYLRRGQPDPLARLPHALRALPMVVLVDGKTAAGAESVAAALKDHARAHLVGQRTMGRGTVQTLRMVPGGGVLKYTSALLEAPSGVLIQGVGVQPHEVVDDPDEALRVAVRRLASP